MPSLVCSAQSCVYNNGMYCSKGDIKVGGDNAETSEETCCTSFRARTSEGAKSSMGTPSQKRLPVRLVSVCTIKIVSVMQIKLEFPVRLHANVSRQSAAHSRNRNG